MSRRAAHSRVLGSSSCFDSPAESAHPNFWSLDRPTRMEPKSLSWIIFALSGVSRLLGGTACIALGVAIPSLHTDHLATDLPSNLKWDLTAIRVVAALFGCIQGLICISGAIVTFRLLWFSLFTIRSSSSCTSSSYKNAYKMEIKANRVLLLFGSILSAVLCATFVSIQVHFCGGNFNLGSAELSRESVCSSLRGVTGSLFAVSTFTTFSFNLIIAIRGFGTFFGICAGNGFLRFIIGSLLQGLGWQMFGTYRIYKHDSLYASLEQVLQRQVDYFFFLVVGCTLACSFFQWATSLVTLVACWRRSQPLLAIDVGVTFFNFWFLLALGCSIFWSLSLRSFFCNIADYYPTQQSALTEGICHSRVVFAVIYVSLWLGIVAVVVAFALCISGFACLRPLEWKEWKHSGKPKVFTE